MSTPRRYLSPTYLRRVAPRIYGGATRRPGGLAASRHAWAQRPPNRIGYLHQLYAISGWTSVPWLRRVRQPTLVVCGDDDPLVPLRSARLLARLVPDARLHVVPGAGHLVLVEDPVGCAQLVREFLADGGNG
jgi:pimeloyl-ACP methyl ester carboxylesterase